MKSKKQQVAEAVKLIKNYASYVGCASDEPLEKCGCSPETCARADFNMLVKQLMKLVVK